MTKTKDIEDKTDLKRKGVYVDYPLKRFKRIKYIDFPLKRSEKIQK